MNCKKLNRLFIPTLATTVLFLTTLDLAEARDRVDRRQTRQHVRVADGIQSGEITRGEAARLRESKRRIRRSENRAEADGTVTEKEKLRLEKMQDARSSQINRLKHNDKTDAPEAESQPVQ